MKHLKLSATVLVLLLTFNFSQAQNKTELENSILWKVEHSDLKESSYILGTLHFMCDEDFKIPEKVTKTLKNVDALVLEIDLSDPKEIQSVQASMLNSNKISEELSKKQYDELDPLVTKIMGMPLSTYDAYSLSTLNFLMISKMLPCTEIKYFENELILLAAEFQKPIFNLEKASQQMEMLKNAYPTDFAFRQLMLFESYKKDFNNAIASYNKEDITTTVDLVTKEVYMDENATRLMLVNRNKEWVEKMPQMMEERSNLFAVGAAHLTHDYGIIELLRQKGYIVTPINN